MLRASIEQSGGEAASGHGVRRAGSIDGALTGGDHRNIHTQSKYIYDTSSVAVS